MNDVNASGAAGFRKYDYAGAYHHTLMGHDPFYIAKIRKALSLVRRDCVVLDVGCGDGVFVKYAREMGARVIGIDASEGGVRLAKKIAGSDELCVGSAHQLPFRTSSADVVVMIDVVNYLSHCEEAIREAARTLKRDGVLVVMSPYEVSLDAERAAIPDSWQTQAWTVEKLRGVTEKYLRVAEVVFIEKDVPVAGLVVLSRWMRAAGLVGVARLLARILQTFVKPSIRGTRASSHSDGGNIVLNTLYLPGMLAGRREKLEFILVARKEEALLS